MYPLKEIQIIIDWKINGIQPKFPNYKTRNRFFKKYENVKVKPFYNSYKIFIGKKEVIPKEIVQNFLSQYFNKPENIITGRLRLYQTLKINYLGITQKDVDIFLSNYMPKQVRKPKPKRTINKPIRTSQPNERWQIDHILLGEQISTRKYRAWAGNQSFKWVLTCIDHFSKYAWVFPTKTKRLNDIDLNPFYDLVRKYLPKIIQADNAFIDEETNKFGQVMEETQTLVINSSPYKPNSNGLVEKFNQTIKNQIFHIFAKNKNKVWYPLIFDLVKGYNNTYHSVIKTTPHKAFHLKQKRKQIQKQINKQARQMVYDTRKQHNEIQVGDNVRILNKTQLPKNKLKKDISNNYSYDVYEVVKISKASRYTNQKVHLKDKKNNEIIRFQSELLKV